MENKRRMVDGKRCIGRILSGVILIVALVLIAATVFAEEPNQDAPKIDFTFSGTAFSDVSLGDVDVREEVDGAPMPVDAHTDKTVSVLPAAIIGGIVGGIGTILILRKRNRKNRR